MKIFVLLGLGAVWGSTIPRRPSSGRFEDRSNRIPSISRTVASSSPPPTLPRVALENPFRRPLTAAAIDSPRRKQVTFTESGREQIALPVLVKRSVLLSEKSNTTIVVGTKPIVSLQNVVVFPVTFGDANIEGLVHIYNTDILDGDSPYILPAIAGILEVGKTFLLGPRPRDYIVTGIGMCTGSVDRRHSLSVIRIQIAVESLHEADLALGISNPGEVFAKFCSMGPDRVGLVNLETLYRPILRSHIQAEARLIFSIPMSHAGSLYRMTSR
jgi:hypothetical protein